MFNKLATAFGVLSILAYIAAIIGCVYGWIHNIIMLVGHTGPWAVMELVRVIGIVVFPIGVVMGYVG